MIRRFLENDQLGWLKSLAIILIWILALAFIINLYVGDTQLAFIDAFIHTSLMFLGFFLLENIFGFYLPKRQQLWMIIIIPMLLAAAATWGIAFLFSWILASHEQFLAYVEISLPLRFSYSFLLLLFWTVLLVMNGKIEDQIKTKEVQQRVEQMRKEAELYHLRQQLQPHFLFNSLNSINALISSRAEEAREMIILLADFLRATISKDSQKWASVREEKEVLNLFLAIEKVRFGHRLHVDFQVEEVAMEMFVPQLMIQPLLENAVKFGVYGVTGEVYISIFIKKISGYLSICISNTFDNAPASSKGTGFGLEAVRRRLFLLFGRNDLMDYSQEGDLFSVNLKIPQQYDQNNNH
jgi:two-component system, LytTR family, sensor kinase